MTMENTTGTKLPAIPPLPAPAGSAAFESGKEAATKVPVKDLYEALEWTAGYMAMLRFRVDQLPNDKVSDGSEPFAAPLG